MKRTAVINVVGLTESLIGKATPHIARFLSQGTRANITPTFPAVTCTAQSTYLTGLTPSEHGIVANGWYNRELAEVQFWKQSNHLVAGKKLWEQLREVDSKVTCAKLFWWYNMYSTADFSITPRPSYPADGRKIFDIYSNPASIRPEITKDLGEFPFFAFWGPAAGVKTAKGSADAASKWIAEAAKWIEQRHGPTLNLIYLPHLDYNLQRFGPKNPQIDRDLGEIDSIVGDLIVFFEKRGVQVILLSEYGISEVDSPIHLNRLFRQAGWLAIKEELGLEMLDCGASKVFAVADHQVAHIYLNDRSLETKVRGLLEAQPGIESVLAAKEQAVLGLNHVRSGDLVAVASERAWFTYYYWLNDRVAPDFAHCVDIHRKPGYDPVELFLDPDLPLVKAKILWRLLQKKLGFRMLMDVIPLNANLVKGSHGRQTSVTAEQPVLISRAPVPSQIDATEVCGIIKGQVLS